MKALAAALEFMASVQRRCAAVNLAGKLLVIKLELLSTQLPCERNA